MTPIRMLTDRARAMRADFDAAFAEPPGQVLVDQDDVLVLEVAGQERAILLAEVAGVLTRPAITALPTPDPAMLGVLSDRGSVSAAWDLGQLLGGPAERPHWLLVPAAEPTVALTFEHFTGFRRVESAQLGPGRTLSLPDLVQSIRERCAESETRR